MQFDANLFAEITTLLGLLGLIIQQFVQFRITRADMRAYVHVAIHLVKYSNREMVEISFRNTGRTAALGVKLKMDKFGWTVVTAPEKYPFLTERGILRIEPGEESRYLLGPMAGKVNLKTLKTEAFNGRLTYQAHKGRKEVVEPVTLSFLESGYLVSRTFR